MSRIVPKLNLNKTPQIVENNSLMFSKNIKLLTDNTFTNDSSIENIITDNSTLGVVIGYIVGVNNKIYFFVNDDNIYKIKEYDEITNEIKTIDCAWTYSGGKITGCVTVNNTGEYILTIAEYFDNEDLNLEHNVPIKHINISPNRCSSNDDESIYTQHPNLPITNLNLIGYYNSTIPAGVYQFFIRYEIRKDFYTAWMPCSKELFAINQDTVSTIQGTLLYNDINKESNKSFIFNIEHLIPENLNNYKRFQLGFIISRDNGSFARSWKHFDINEFSTISQIMFSFDEHSVEDISIDELIATNYELFNVKNVISYKDKLYVSNYKETNFNDHDVCDNFARSIQTKINIKEIPTVDNNKYYINDREIIKETIDNVDYFTTFDDESKISTVYDNKSYNATTYSDVQYLGYPDPYLPYDEEFYNMCVGYIVILYNDETNRVLFGNIYNNRHYYNKNQSVELTGQQPQTTEVIDLEVNNTSIREEILGVDENGNWIDKSNKKVIKGFRYLFQQIKWQGIEAGLRKIIFNQYVCTYNKELVNGINTKTFTTVENVQDTLIPFTTYDFYCHLIKENGIVTNGFYICSKKINKYAEYVHRDSNNVIKISDYGNKLIDVVSETGNDDLHEIGEKLELDKVLCETIPTSKQLHVHYKADFGVPGSTEVYTTLTFNLEELDKNTIIYPTFKPTVAIPDGYIGYFISMYKHENNVAQGFNIKNYTHTTTEGNETVEVFDGKIKFDCLECDTLLYKYLENIKIKNYKGEVISNKGEYISSGTTNPIEGFGSFGFIKYDSESEINDSTIWVIGNEETISSINKQLIKTTPYVYLNSQYNNYTNLNLQGYICNVCKLSKKDEYYISDTDIYLKQFSNPNIETSDTILESVNTKVVTYNTVPSVIHSNFNLSCISLTEELFPKIRTYEEGGDTKSQVIFAVNSLIASYIFKLEETFKTYVRKTYSEYNEDNLVVFNNTIRSSNIDVDETYRNIYRFDATDYYNVPTNRGIIINLFNILNTIYIHTEHSLFKFVDNKQLTSEDGNVLLQESNIFDTGIQEVFDAQYGHGGLCKKEHSLINYEYYIFYDKLAKTIYAYNGESDLVVISDPIKKLMKHFNAEDILFAGDNYNDRFFINLRRTRTIDNVETIENVCLSYNLKAKSFISIHDIDFDKSFNSRINTYFLQYGTPTNVFKIDNDSALGITNYSGVFKSSYLKCSDIDSYNEANSVASCIDIIYNQDYEIIKNLDYINWICRAIENYADNDYNLAEEIGSKYSGTAVRIYTDETKSEIIPLVDNAGIPLEANNQSISAPESYQYPRYNCGIWSLNYFRDVKNRTDDFNYNEKVPLPNARALYQEDSLLYGKYFIVRFIFKNKNFKLENIKLSLKNYGKA